MQNKQTHLVYGIISGIIMVITGLIMYQTGIIFKPGMKYLSYLNNLPFLICIILNGMAYSKANDSFVTFGNVFSSCFKASLVAGVIMLVWSIICIFLFPEMKEKILEMVHQELLKNPAMTDETIETAINMQRKFWNVFMILGSIFNALFWGALFSLLGGAFAKKKGERPMSEGNY